MNCKTPCDTCAFTEGSAANLEPHNAIKGQLCVLGGIPFYCHHEMAWDAPDADRRRTAQELRAQGFRVCAGWKREVVSLAATGYFKEHRELTRIFAQLGMGQLAILCSKDLDEEEKEEAKRVMERVFERLVEYRNKCLKHSKKRPQK